MSTKLLSVREVAAALGVTSVTVRRWVQQGRVEPHGRTPGGHIRFRADQLEEMVSGAQSQSQSQSHCNTDEARHIAAAREHIRALRRSA